mgnify:CR=1 FL=1
MVGVPPWLALTSVGAALVQVILAPVGPVRVHDMVPAGLGLLPLPATRAVRVATPPKDGDEAVSEMMGVKLEILKEMLLELTPR